MALNTPLSNAITSNSNNSQDSPLSTAENDAVAAIASIIRGNQHAASLEQMERSVHELAKTGFKPALEEAKKIGKHAPRSMITGNHMTVYHQTLEEARKDHPKIKASTKYSKDDIARALTLTSLHKGCVIRTLEFLHALASTTRAQLPENNEDFLLAIKELWGVDYPALVANYALGSSEDDAILVD